MVAYSRIKYKPCIQRGTLEAAVVRRSVSDVLCVRAGGLSRCVCKRSLIYRFSRGRESGLGQRQSNTGDVNYWMATSLLC